MSVSSYEEFHRKCRDVFPVPFEGIKGILNKGLSSHFQISHSINLASNQNGYRFGATYAGSQKTALPDETFPGIAYVQQSKLMTVQGVMEYRTRLSNSCLTIADPNILQNTGGIVASHVQQITDNLQLGAELVAFAGSAKPGQSEVMKVFSGGFRYFTPRWSAALTGSEIRSLLRIITRRRILCSLVLFWTRTFASRRPKLLSLIRLRLPTHLCSEPRVTLIGRMVHNFGKPITKVGIGLILSV
uniref:Uncharacterized protein n=1 Tax=Ditylenchus dipsaci TaxID=166011 RepID=A0A915ENL4_9BILA